MDRKLPFLRGALARFLGLLPVLAALLAGPRIADAQAPTCSIADSLQSCWTDSTRLCGPTGAYTYVWSNGDTARCITVGPGTWSLVIRENGVPSTNPCTFIVANGPDSVAVTKTAESEVNDGSRIHYVLTVRNTSASTSVDSVRVVDQLCDGARWLGNSTMTPSSQPANDTAGGQVEWMVGMLSANQTVEIRYEVLADLADTTCTGDLLCGNEVVVHARCGGTGNASEAGRDSVSTWIRCDADTTGGGGDFVGSCPRGYGWWKKQCGNGHGHGNGQGHGNGHAWGRQPRFSDDDMDDILDRIEERFVAFDWSGDSEDFCDLLAPGRGDVRDRALRQVALFMANWAAGDLDLTPTRGGRVGFDPDGEVDCDEFGSETIDELVDELDGILADLDGEDMDSDVREQYEAIEACLGALNEGDGLELADDCDGDHDDDGDHGDDDDARTAPSFVSAATPNPFSQSTGFRYEVANEGGADVSITVFNVAGRQVRSLVDAHREVGEHRVTWDGRTDDGLRAPRGVYFVRAVVDGRQAPAQRLLFLRD